LRRFVLAPDRLEELVFLLLVRFIELVFLLLVCFLEELVFLLLLVFLVR